MEAPAKEGMLHLQGVKFGKKTWRRTWAMLFQPSSSGIGRVELYDLRDGVGSPGLTHGKQGLKKADKRVIRLADCLSITPAPDEACPRDCTTFCLSTTQRDYILAAMPGENWVPMLCQLAFQRNDRNPNLKTRQTSEEASMSENELYSSWDSVTSQYQVTVQRTEAAMRCNLAGSYLLSPNNEAIVLLDLYTAHPIYQWPYQLLRRFGQDKEGVTIEAGRRCESGEGHFTFLSKDASQIYRAIEEGIRHQSVTDLKLKAQPPVSACTSASGSWRSQMGSVSNPQERTSPALPPRNVSLPSHLNRLPAHQLSQPAAEPLTTLYATTKPQLLKVQQTLPVISREDKEQYLEEKEQVDEDLSDEERLCSLESICLDEKNDEVSPLYSNLKRWIEGEEERKVQREEVIEGDRAQSDSPSQESIYSMLNIHQIQEKEFSGEGSQASLDLSSSVITTTEIPIDFKTKLSNILSKDLAKVQPLSPARTTDTVKAVFNE